MKENFLDFYIRKISFLNNEKDTNLNFIPPISRRRLSMMDKVVLSTLENVYTDDIENIVFSSYFGEYEKLIKIISQYQKNKEVSPNLFSGSVHNFSLGFFLLNKKKPIPYNALSFPKDNISEGILSAIISNYANVIFCYSDIKDNNYISLSLNITKKETSDFKKYRIKLKENSACEPKFTDYVSFFTGDKNILDTPTCTFERLEKC